MDFFTLANLFHFLERSRLLQMRKFETDLEKKSIKIREKKIKNWKIFSEAMNQKMTSFWIFHIYFFLIFLCTLFTHMLLKNERMHFLYIDLSQCTFCQRFRWFVKWPAINCPLFRQLFSQYCYIFLRFLFPSVFVTYFFLN